MLKSRQHDSTRFHIDLSVIVQESGGRVQVSGWICSRAEAHKLTLHINGIQFSAPIGFPRPDVYKALNSDNRYPFIHSYFCGLSSDLEFDPGRMLVNGIDLCIAVISEKDGNVLAERHFKLNSENKASIFG